MLYDETALSNAVIFNHAFDILYKQFEDGSKNLIQDFQNKKAKLDAALIVPVLTNGAFACELYIKSLLPPNTRKHKLYELYNELSDELKEQIQNLHVEFMKNSSSNYTTDDFYSDLQRHSNVFVTWRYFHEGDTTSAQIPFMCIFLKTLNAVCRVERVRKDNTCM